MFFYLSSLLFIQCRDMHFFDNHQPIIPHLSKRKWDNHPVAWYYWKGRLDLLKNGGILWLLLWSVDRGRDRLKRLQKIPFRVTGEAGNLQILALHKNAVEERISINIASIFQKIYCLPLYSNLPACLFLLFHPPCSLAVPLEMSQWLRAVLQLKWVVIVPLASMER